MTMALQKGVAIETSLNVRSRLFSNWTHYLYLVPIFLFLAAFVYYTIGYTFFISFFDWNGVSKTKTFIGINHYVEISKDPIFYGALRNTVIYMIVSILTQMFLGLLIALMLKSQVKFKSLYKVIFFLPTVLSQAVIAYVFRQIYDANGGQLNQFFEAIGVKSLSLEWLSSPHLALYSIIAINIWEFTGFSFILYFAALSVVDKEIYEAARIEGANFIQIITKLIFPLLRSTHYSLIILGVIGSLKTFDLVFLTTGGGPGRASEVLSTYIYKKTILEYNAGYSSALSMIMLVIALALTVIQLRAYKVQ
jgi:raffinose/stachyose/melibiose transport system permease protein